MISVYHFHLEIFNDSPLINFLNKITAVSDNDLFYDQLINCADTDPASPTDPATPTDGAAKIKESDAVSNISSNNPKPAQTTPVIFVYFCYTYNII